MRSRLMLTASIVWSAAVLALAAPAAARQGELAPTGPAPADVASAASLMPALDPTLMRAAAKVYRLEADSSYRNACFDPCDCIMDLRSPLSGTMQLRLVSARPCQREYVVQDVNFRVRIGGGDVLIRGQGRYTWSCSLGPLTVLAHRLVLTLRAGEDGPVQTFDSEQIAGASDGVFPPIRIVIDKNNQVCTDEVLTLNATPVPESSLAPYRLLEGSAYAEGCWDPCACPIAMTPLAGAHALVPLPSRPDTPTVREWAVVRVGWGMAGPATSALAGRAGGSGFYLLRPSDAAMPEQRMLLSLLVLRPAAPAPTPPREKEFDSGWVAGPALVPALPPVRVDIDVAANGFYCFDQVFSIRSAR